MLKWIVQNKYKLMALIIGLYLLVDVLQHKGQTRILFAKSFPGQTVKNINAAAPGELENTGKAWSKGINSVNQLSELKENTAGFEVDVYFDSAKKIFDVHHDAGKSTGLDLDVLLKMYDQKKLAACIWLDIKNLDEKNSNDALTSLIRLREQYVLHNKLIVESPHAELLGAFTDSLFFTSLYVPMFNPYRLNDQELKVWADKISMILKISRVNALSGYYFQYSFLQHYFPGYPVLTWADKDPFSLVNLFFRKKIEGNKALSVILYP